jgi:hypothetical protein
MPGERERWARVPLADPTGLTPRADNYIWFNACSISGDMILLGFKQGSA